MNLYIDTSALIKRYVTESYSQHVLDWMEDADIVATALVTRAESSAGINRLLRMKSISITDYTVALDKFRAEWIYFERISVTEHVVARADELTCRYVLRGYDSIHLACALTWQEMLRAPVALATFDTELREAAQKAGLGVLPE
jgi:predicted nucleic acid-binding protein